MRIFLLGGLLSLSLGVSSAMACTFNWQHYGSDQVFDRIKPKIGDKVPDSYCSKFNKNYQIVIVTNEYVNSVRSLAHVRVGLRKRGSNDMIVKSMSAYKFEDGNFVVAKGYDMAASLALETVMDVMSDPASFLN